MEKMRASGKFEYVYRSGRKFELFKPYPLPPILPTINFNSFEKVNNEAELALSKLNGISSMLPNIGLINTIFLKKEIIASINLNEHNPTNKNIGNDFSKFETDDDFLLAKNLLDSFHNIKKYIEKSSDILLFDALKNMNLIGTTENVEHNELNQWAVHDFSTENGLSKPNIHTVNDNKLIFNFDEFINDSSYSTVTKIAIASAQFNIMSPLKLNNGIYARFLIPLLIEKLAINNGILLCASSQFEKNKHFFQKLLINIINYGNWEDWILFIHKSVIEISNNTTLKLTQIFQSIAANKQKLLTVSNGSLLLFKIFEYAQANQSVTVEKICSHFNVTFSAVNIAIDKLLDLKIIGEITGNKRNRVFSSIIYIDYLFRS